MRRLALLAVGGALWLFAAAIPALADGGPHVAAINNGSAGLTSDSCAGCHRAHTAQGAFLLKEEGTALCTSCHGSAGTGATTNVADGVQYQLAAAGGPTVRGAVLGALRNGGFTNARIDSANGVAVSYISGTRLGRDAKVPVAASGTPVTSKHLSLTAEAPSTVWGNGPLGAASAGATVTLECTSCHNPHGNGNFRILNPIPTFTPVGTFIAATTGVNVTDAALPPAGDNRNYTVIQTVTGATSGTSIGSYINTSLLASQVASYGATAGDYLHRKLPWNGGWNGGAPSVPTSNDAPNGDPLNFDAQMNAWCATCHTRYTTSTNAVNNPSAPNPVTGLPYVSGTGPYNVDSGDAIFTYRHPTTSNKPCTTCHVSHGSNAQMTGYNSTHEAYPGAGSDPTVVANADSRLLKVDNRGTCQLCHNPTNPAVIPANAGIVFPTGAAIPPVP